MAFTSPDINKDGILVRHLNEVRSVRQVCLFDERIRRDSLNQLVFFYKPAGTFDEKLQNVEGLWSDLYGLVIVEQLTVRHVERDRPEFVKVSRFVAHFAKWRNFGEISKDFAPESEVSMRDEKTIFR